MAPPSLEQMDNLTALIWLSTSWYMLLVAMHEAARSARRFRFFAATLVVIALIIRYAAAR